MRSNFNIVVTGKNKKVALDICEHLENDRGYLTTRCEPTRGNLFDTVMTVMSKVVIICLGDETAETIQAYNILGDVAGGGSIITIVVANEDDERFFMKYSNLEKVFFVSRPVPLYALYEKLMSIEEQVNHEQAGNNSVIREYINEDPAKDDTGRKHIAVVDDDPEQLFNIREQLKDFFDVTLLKSGDDLYKYLLRKRPDLILLDYVMPNRSGPEILRTLRGVEEYADIPVVFLTGVSGRDAIITILSELHPQGYLIKPAKKSELIGKIIEILG